MEAFCSDGNVPEQQKDYDVEDIQIFYMDELSQSMQAKEEREEVGEIRRRELFGFRRGFKAAARRVVNSVFCPFLPEPRTLREAAERTRAARSQRDQTRVLMAQESAAAAAAEAAAEDAAFAAVNAARVSRDKLAGKEAAALTLEAAAQKTAADKAAAERQPSLASLRSTAASEKTYTDKTVDEKVAAEEAAAVQAPDMALQAAALKAAADKAAAKKAAAEKAAAADALWRAVERAAAERAVQKVETEELAAEQVPQLSGMEELLEATAPAVMVGSSATCLPVEPVRSGICSLQSCREKNPAHVNPPKAKFCILCGTKLEATVPWMPSVQIPAVQPYVSGCDDGWEACLSGSEHWRCGGYPPVFREQLATTLARSGSEEEQFEMEMQELEELVGFEQLFVAELAVSSTEFFHEEPSETSKDVPAHVVVEAVDI
jgi:hypothetical protein